MSVLLAWVGSAVGVGLAAKIVPGVKLGGVKGALVVAGIFGLLQMLLGPVLFAFIGIATLGIGFWLSPTTLSVSMFLTRVLVSTLLLMLTDKVVGSFEIKGKLTAVIVALLMTSFSSGFQWLLG